MSEWEELYLSDVGTLARGKSKHRPRWAAHLYGGPYPFIQTGNISAANKYITAYQQTYSEAGLTQSKLWDKGTLCITIAANIAEIAILEFSACFPDSVLGFIPDPEKANLDFVFYTLTFFKDRIQSLAIGSVQENINLGTFKNIKFLFPPIEEQKEISAALSCLDRKIENLRKQNETLEQIAQTLFKRWFVDFEFPYDFAQGKPSADGKPYKSSGGEMVPSELGEIPAGWRVGKMEDIIEVRDGTHDSPKQTNQGFPLITSKHLKKGGIDFESAYLISESDYIEVNKRSRVSTYDILLSMIGTVGLLYFVMDKKINFAIKNIGLFKASQNLNFSEYIFLFLSSDYGKTYFRTRLAGTTQSYLTLGSLRNMSLIIPDLNTLLKFKQLAQSLLEKTHTNNQQIQTLTQTRDALLPKLMSGKLRIKT